MAFSPRELRRTLKRMGIEAQDLDASRVTIELGDGRRLIIESPQVVVVRARGQPTMLYVVGEPKEAPGPQAQQAQTSSVSDEDARLVAEQTGVDIETARRALIEAKGDIAEAILRLKGSP